MTSSPRRRRLARTLLAAATAALVAAGMTTAAVTHPQDAAAQTITQSDMSVAIELQPRAKNVYDIVITIVNHGPQAIPTALDGAKPYELTVSISPNIHFNGDVEPPFRLQTYYVSPFPYLDAAPPTNFQQHRLTIRVVDLPTLGFTSRIGASLTARPGVTDVGSPGSGNNGAGLLVPEFQD